MGNVDLFDKLKDCTLFDPNQGLGFSYCLGSQICGHCTNVLTEGFHCWVS